MLAMVLREEVGSVHVGRVYPLVIALREALPFD